jgi:hypothetical protein
MGRGTSHRPFQWERHHADTLVERDDERLVVRIETIEAALLMKLLDLTGDRETRSGTASWRGRSLRVGRP